MYATQRIIITVVRQHFHFFLLSVNILSVLLIFFDSIGLNLSFLYISFIRFVANSNSLGVVIRTPVISLSIANHTISSLGYLGFQIPLWDASNRVIVWFSNIILTLFLIILYISIIVIFIWVPYLCFLFFTALIHLCSQRYYLLLGFR